MVHVIEVGGVDPGLVHTGVVRLSFDTDSHNIFVRVAALDGADVQGAKKFFSRTPQVFIEGYKPRSNLGTDQRMVEMVADFRMGLKGSKVLLNTGVKKVVRQPLMELVGCYDFSLPTHHQDLRSAARIALLGMLKDDTLNRVLTDVVLDNMQGLPWSVHH
jgi:hypothetical protein